MEHWLEIVKGFIIYVNFFPSVRFYSRTISLTRNENVTSVMYPEAVPKIKSS